MYVKLYEVYIWILVLGSRGKCKRAIHVNKIFKKKNKKPEVKSHFMATNASGQYICNDRTFCVGILRGHGVAGRYIVVLGHSYWMFGCLGNLVTGLPRRQWRQGAPRGGESVLSRAL